MYHRLMRSGLYPVNLSWDRKVNEIFDLLECEANYKDIQRDLEHLREELGERPVPGERPVHRLRFCKYDIWLSNFPYAFGYPIPPEGLGNTFPKVLPTIDTRFRIRDFLVNRFHMVEKDGQFFLSSDPTNKERGLSTAEKIENFVQNLIEATEKERENND